MKRALIISAFSAVVLTNCRDDKPRPVPAPPPVPVTDTKPVGDGLKVIGYALLGAAVVITVGRVLR